MPAGIYKRNEFHLKLLALARTKITPESIEKNRIAHLGKSQQKKQEEN